MFADDYFVARDTFCRLAGKQSTPLQLSVRGPHGEPLSIDTGWLGDRSARRILLVVSGLHGIEGFAGSAVQCAFLARAPDIPANCAVALVHAMNPWGFAHLRRVNENNVDLNRNFLRADEPYAGAPPLYASLDAFLNPRSTPRADAFALRALAHAYRHGFAHCRQAIAEGQYEYERGLFFGGRELQEGPRLLQRWLGEACAQATQLLVLDLHTGLGRFGARTILAEPHAPPPRIEALATALNSPIRGGAGIEAPGGFAARGSLGGGMAELLAGPQVEFLTVEFGTLSGARILHALREENRWHFYGTGAPDHPSKQRLLAAFRPDTTAWRNAVLDSGTSLLRRAVRAIAEI